MSTLSIRPARLYDVPALARIERQSFTSPWSADAITHDVIENERAFVAVAELDGVTAGYADMWIIADEAQLYNIAISPEFRGRGIGSILLRYMAEKAEEAGCRILLLEVRRSNIPAISMYRKNGFKESGLRKGYYAEDAEDAVLMDKEISEGHRSGDSGDLEVEIDTI